MSLKNKLGIKDADSNFVPDQKALNVIFKEYDLLVEENGNLLDKYLRALAEVENTRRRSNKQVEEAKIFAVQNFSKDLLEVKIKTGRILSTKAAEI